MQDTAVPTGLMTTMLDACQTALALVESHWIEDHGREDVGVTWGRLSDAVVAGRARLFPHRRYVARPHPTRGGWQVVDTQHPLGARAITDAFPSAEAIRLEGEKNASMPMSR